MLWRQGVVTGTLFAGIGAAALAAGWTYPMGSATRMGPGYFPALLAFVLIGLGAAIALAGLRAAPAPMPRLALRPAAALVGAMLAFALLLPAAGLLPASVATVVLASLADRESRRREVVLLAAALAGFAALLFVQWLGLTISLLG